MTVGLTTQLSIRQFMSLLFTENELSAQSSSSLDMPLTDEEAEKLIRQEFANCPSVISSLDNIESISMTSRIRSWRSEYNRGLWNEKPTYYSFRYGAKGVPINRHLNPLTPEQIRNAILSHPTDPRKERYAHTDTEEK